jgi:hypothetical protein
MGYIKGAQWEPGTTLTLPPPPPPNRKGKNATHFKCVLAPSQSRHETSLRKRVHHHFWPDLYPSQVQLFLVEFD